MRTGLPELFNRFNHQTGANHRFAFMLSVMILLILTGMTGCAGTPSTPLTPGERPTDTPLPAAPAWRVAAHPITVDNVPQLTQLGRLEAPGTPTTVFAWALSPDNTRLVALNNSFLLSWDLVTGRLVFSTSRDDATRVFYSPDKDQVFAVATDGSIYVVNSEDGTFENTLLGIQGYNDVSSYDPDEGLLALASAPGDIKVWNLIDQVELITLPGSGSQAIALAFSPDNSLLAIGYDLGIVLIWDWRNQIVKAVPVLPDNQSGAVDQLLFSPDGQYLIGTAGDAGLVWSVSDGALLHTLPVGVGGSNYLFKTSPTGPFIITGGTAADATLWNILDGKLASALPDMGGNNLDGVFSPDGNLLFTSLYTDEVVLWNLANLANGSIARSNQPIENSNILNLIWTDDGFLVLLIDARGPIEVWGIP